MPQNPPRQRAAQRFGLALPVTMDGQACTSHDVSATGVLLQSARPVATGLRVQLQLHPHTQGSMVRAGEVVRSQAVGDSWNVAVRLEWPLFHEAALQEGGTG